MNYLIVANGASVSEALLKSEINTADKIILLDGAFNHFPNSHSFDFLLGDFDSLVEDTESEQEFKRIHAPDQNKTDLEKGIDFALENGARSIRVLNVTGKRMDHTFANISLLKRFDFPIFLIDDHSVIYRLPNHFEKHFQKGQIISLLPIGLALNITTHNLVYPLKNEALELGLRNGNSNEVAADGNVIISHESGCLLLMECVD
ncbi:MAG: thiamine diphosphokinase [Fluviicola sp.]